MNTEEKMKRRIFAIVVVALILAAALLAGGCSGQMNMITGRWKLMTSGDANAQNQQQYPLPVSVDIYPNGRVNMLESPFGKYTMSGDTFTFVSDDGTMKESGSFTIDSTKDESTGNTVPQLTIFLDSNPVSYVFQKQADLGPLESYLRSAAAASKAPAATAAPVK
jgi:hypothetical protein